MVSANSAIKLARYAQRPYSCTAPTLRQSVVAVPALPSQHWPSGLQILTNLTTQSCMRCIKAHRVCGGYEDGEFTAFRQYGPQAIDETSPSGSSPSTASTARKCSLPARVPVPNSDVLTEDAIPPETSEEESNELALRAFFYDFCITSPNANISRGYLSSIEALAHRLGPGSDLVKACQIISFASHGKPLNRPSFVTKGEFLYQDLLGSLARTMNQHSPGNFVEARLKSMLLGLYQITMATETDYGHHEAHCGGLIALMKAEQMPLSTLSIGVLPGPLFVGPAQGLDSLLIGFDSLWTRQQAPLSVNDLREIRNESIALDQQFVRWQSSRASGFEPTTMGYVRQAQYGSDVSVGYWPGRIDTYFDLYVAGIWNIFRATRLLLKALIIKLSDAVTNATEPWIMHVLDVNRIFEDLAASIPYHLTENLHEFLGELTTSTEITDPGRSLGGLLLMHPLYVAANISLLSDANKEYLRKCLLWIGAQMGIGQAALLANVSQVYSASSVERCP
ncbi:uncharacterized protein JN550_006421 [Neoarthrinium moseri]|uniref:uncharacterized protein n=1 Tax=Neoarthrinium moseri TaxID=1658444 RepID=UPI001FDD731A|nr:uncharacterized protein JN550_006421 [Neoarthrinium moseri]KAI1868505.1 hypothetical protein JN550_006421 [Neoarthrinium moseri]